MRGWGTYHSEFCTDDSGYSRFWEPNKRLRTAAPQENSSTVQPRGGDEATMLGEVTP